MSEEISEDIESDVIDITTITQNKLNVNKNIIKQDFMKDDTYKTISETLKNGTVY